MKRFALLALALLLTATLGAAPVSAESSAIYIVRPGDTLTGIAARYGVSVCDLAAANNLSWCSWVYAGQRLYIPGRQAEGSVIHVVFRGDTLWRISQMYNTTVRAIMEANSLTSTLIFPGQRLVIPAPESTVDGWVGTVVKLPAGNQFGSYFLRSDGQRYDIGTTDDAVRDQLAEVCWSGAQVIVWGRVYYGVPATEARHIEVDRLEVVGSAAEVRNLSPFASASASSTLPSDRWGTYAVYMAIDGQLATSWVEGVAGPGAGQWMELTFPQPVTVQWLGLDGGYDRDADIFAKNNRIKHATISFSDGRSFKATLADARGVQKVTLPASFGGSVQTSKVRVTIEEVYPGSRYDDTCLAELEVWGRTD